MSFQRLGFFHRDDAILADFLHGFGNDGTDGLIVVGADGADLGNHVSGNRLGELVEFALDAVAFFIEAATNGGDVLAVPASLSDDHAALIEPLAVATHDVRRADVKAGDRVIVFGGGPIGTLIALVCRHRGARVAVAEINPFRLEMLARLGLETIGPDRDAITFANDWSGGTGVDVAFEVTGQQVAVTTVTDVVRVWGTVSIVAIHAEPMRVNLYQMFARELTMHGSRLYAREDWEEAIRLAASGAVPVGPLVSRRVPLEALQEGMETALAGGAVMKVLIDLTA